MAASLALGSTAPDCPPGMGEVLFGVSVGRRGWCSEIYFGDPVAEVDTTRFTAAEDHRTELEASYGESLTWEPLAETTAVLPALPPVR